VDDPGRDLPAEQATLARLQGFVESTVGCFERSHPEGHVTGSALVVTPSLDRVLLMLHGKLGRWLQLGGHADGDPRVEQVALKEAEEESGLSDLGFLPYERLLGTAVSSPLPFDLDVHAIPSIMTCASWWWPGAALSPGATRRAATWAGGPCRRLAT